jgi:peptidoglycan/LPS O-acetylase OafA/YrhL
MRVATRLLDPRRQRIATSAAVSALALIALVVLTVHPSGALDGGLMFMLPALALAAILFAGRYPGERVIARLGSPRARRLPRRAKGFAAPRARPLRQPRGGRLIAASLAGRAPPLVAGCR